jgi:hypothetical protein
MTMMNILQLAARKNLIQKTTCSKTVLAQFPN